MSSIISPIFSSVYGVIIPPSDHTVTTWKFPTFNFGLQEPSGQLAMVKHHQLMSPLLPFSQGLDAVGIMKMIG